MNIEHPFDDIEEALDDFNIEGEKSISPDSKDSKDNHHQKLFSSPIHVAEFFDQHKQESTSPDLFIEFTSSFKRIMEKDNEESSQNEELLDIMGHRIRQFDLKIQPQEESGSPFHIEDDKENELPTSYLNTPLKIKRKDIRSPLQDITPSMTQKKKKTNSKLMVSEKNRFMTPRTMEKSGLASSGLRRIERF